MSNLRIHAVEIARRGDYRTAFKMLIEAVDEGDLSAFNDMGVIAERHGRYDDAMEDYLLAHEQGVAVASRNIGSLYERGLGVKQDYKKAIHYYTIACKGGYAPAYADLADLARKGHGMRKSRKKALEYLNEGLKHETVDDPRCSLGIAYYYQNEHPRKAFELYKKTARSGNPRHLYYLATCYIYGLGVKVNAKKGMDLLYTCGEREYGDAFYELAKIYYEGKLVEKDSERAFYWLERGLNEKNLKSLLLYAEMLLTDDNPNGEASVDHCVKLLKKYLSLMEKVGEEQHHLLFDDFKERHKDLVDWDEFVKNPEQYVSEMANGFASSQA